MDQDRDAENRNDKDEQSRPQQGGEAGTTRFGMEDGDNTDTPATGGPQIDDQAAERSS